MYFTLTVFILTRFHCYFDDVIITSDLKSHVSTHLVTGSVVSRGLGTLNSDPSESSSRGSLCSPSAILVGLSCTDGAA